VRYGLLEMNREGSAITVRPTVEGDEEALWLMLYYASHSDDEPGIRPEDIRSNSDLVGYIDGWRDGGRIGVIAERAGVCVGAAWLRTLSEADRDNPVFSDVDTPELAIAVLPAHQSQGIGTCLMRALLENAPEVPAIVLSARRGNPAIRLYERFGFEPIGEMTNRVGTVSVRMRRGPAE
jgi:ribosomal protein S18 acetylase RimI-like enzyme